MSKLNVFLKDNVKEVGIVKRAISDRFSDENGNPVEFEFKPVKLNKINMLTELCTTKDFSSNPVKIDFDYNKFQKLLITETMTYPNLRDVELQESWGVMDAEELIDELFLSGEFKTISKIVSDVNGHADDLKLEMTAKN